MSRNKVYTYIDHGKAGVSELNSPTWKDKKKNWVVVSIGKTDLLEYVIIINKKNICDYVNHEEAGVTLKIPKQQDQQNLGDC